MAFDFGLGNKGSWYGDVDPERESAFWSNLGAGALTGLGYVGSKIDKYTGSRALRGLLGGLKTGNFREGLSFLPFSDAIGLTDPADMVTGAKLNSYAFGTNEKPDLFSLEGLGGIGTEVLLNPMNVVGFGSNALTNVGKQVYKAGVLPRKVSQRFAGFQRGTRELVHAAREVSKLTGKTMKETKAAIAGVPLGGHMGIGLPFGLTDTKVYNWGPTLGKAWGAVTKIPYAGPALQTGASGLQYLKGVFGRPQQGAKGPAQDIAESLFANKPGQNLADFQHWTELEKKLPAGARKEGFQRWLSRYQEGVDPVPPEYQPYIDAYKEMIRANLHNRQEWGLRGASHLSDYNLPTITDAQVRRMARESRSMARKLGRQSLMPPVAKGLPGWQIGTQPLKPLEYSYRQPHPDFLEALGKAQKAGIGKGLTAIPEEGAVRYNSWKHIPTDRINDLWKRSDITYGPKGFEKLTKPQLQDEIFTQYLGQNLDELRALQQHKRFWRDMGMKIDPATGQPIPGGELKFGPKSSSKAATVITTRPWDKANPHLHERLKVLEDMYKNAGDLAELRLYTGQMKDVFPHHPTAILLRKVMRDGENVLKAKELHRGFAAAAMTKAEAAAQGIKGTPLKEALEGANLTIEGQAMQRTLEALQDVHGPTATNIDDFVIPPGLAADVVRIGKRMSSPVELKNLIDNFVDPVTQAIKSGQTVIWPGYHIRDIISSGWQHWVHNAVDPKAATLMDGILNPLKWAQDMRAGKIFDRANEIPDLAGKTLAEANEALQVELKWARNSIGKQAHHVKADPKHIMTLQELLPGPQPGFGAQFGALKTEPAIHKLSQTGRNVASYIDDVKQGGAYLAKRMQGYSPVAALQEVMKIHYNYIDKALADPVMRRLVPYWGWIRNNLPATLKEIIEKPGGKIANAARVGARARGEEPGFLPDQLGGGLALQLGQEKAGTQKFLSQIGLPFEDIAGPIANPAAPLGMLNPLIKYPLEQMTQRQFFTGRDLNDLYSRTPAPQWAENLAMNSPFGRAITTAGKLGDERKSLGEKTLNFLTGIRTTDVDMEKARTQAGRQELERLLRGLPHVRQAPGRPYIPKALRDQATEEEKALLALYGGLR